MIKIIALDLDNTLLNKAKQITEYNKKMIEEAKNLGIYVVLASGRPLNGIMPLIKELNLTSENDYVFSFNGGKIYNVGKNECIFESLIEGENVKEIYELSKHFGYFFHAFKADGSLICPLYNHYTDIEATINKVECQIKSINEINNKDKFIKAMIIDSKEHIDYAFSHVPNNILENYNVVRSSDIFLEFLNKNNDKGLALKWLADYLNINIKDTMAIGDASNDLGMIKMAGVGVAMQNACEQIKNAATYVTASCEDSGVGKAIDHFLHS